MDKDIDIRTLPLVAAGRARGGRATQQDDLVCLHDAEHSARLMVLADGMGGDGGGELASAGVIDVARRLWQDGLWRDEPGAVFLERLCQGAHTELRRIGRELDSGAPHSTVVALLTRGERAYWAHVGDSRLFHFRGRRCVDRTEDHSLGQLKVRRGELSAEQLADDPEQHKLLRGLGGPQPPQVDHGGALLRPGQTFALCSDGVWERLSTQELGQLTRQRDQQRAVRDALGLALERGGEAGDNVSLILFRVGWSEWIFRRCTRW